MFPDAVESVYRSNVSCRPSDSYWKAYDAIAITRYLGLETVAIDIAPTAVEAAKLYDSSSLQAAHLSL